MIGIYAIRNTMNEKMYIGESIDINEMSSRNSG